MKQKLFTLLTLLVLCVTGAWADDVYECYHNGTSVVNTSNYFSSGNSLMASGYNSNMTITFTNNNGDEITSSKFTKMTSGKGVDFTVSDDHTASVFVVAVTKDKTSNNGIKLKKQNGDNWDDVESYTSAPTTTYTRYETSFSNLEPGTYRMERNGQENAAVYVKVVETATSSGAYTITKSDHANGDFTISSSSADEGDVITLSANPNDGFMFNSWKIHKTGYVEQTIEPESNTANTTFTMPAYDVTVKAYFAAIPFIITHTAAEHGTYTIQVAAEEPVSENTVGYIGQTVYLVATPDDGYVLSAWNVKDADNNDVTVTNNQFTMPAKAVTISPVFSEPIVLNTLFSMTNITGPTESLSKGDVADVEATFTQGGSAEVFQNSSGTMFYNNNSINLNGSGSSYLHVIFPNNVILQAGDVIDAELLTGALKVSASTSSASSITLPYTIKTTDTKLIGATGLYFFKDGAAQVTSVTIKGQGAISDFAIISSTTPTVAIGNESTITYTSSSTGAVTFTSSDNAVASITDGGVITAKEGGTATITINQDADETYRAALAKITVTVPEVVFVKIKTLGGSSTKVTGTMDVTTGITADVNLSSNRKMDKGKYVGFTLNGENAIQTGDIIEVKLSAAGQGGKFIFYDSKGDNPTVLYNTNVSPDEAKVYRFVVPAAMNGVKTTYLRRGGDNSGINEGFNPVFEYIAICRPSGEITLNASGYATYSSATNFLISGAKAYEATLNTADKKITCTEVEAVPAGAGVLLFGDAGAKVAIINTTSADALTDNDLKGTTQAGGTLATFDTAKYYYALSGDTFKHYTGSAFVENKAYFESDTELNSKAFTIVFDGETTGINAIEEVAPVTTKTRKVVKNGRLVIETANGEFTVSGARIK